MTYYSRDQIKNSVTSLYESRQKSAAARVKSFGARVRVFLSHSHADKVLDPDLIAAAQIFLGDLGVEMYIDSEDATMPERTTPETAIRLKAAIGECNRFLLLATDRALQSVWCPWELGVADVLKSMDNVVIWPITERKNGSWSGNEYVGIYSYIDEAGSGQPAVFKPGEKTGELLWKWLMR